MSGPLLAPGDVIQFKTYCYLGNQVGINTYYYLVDSTSIAPPDLSQVGAALDLNFAQPAYLEVLCNDAHYYGSSTTLMTGVTPYAPFYENANDDNGIGGAVPLAAQTCGLLSKVTDLRGPKYRGRVYIPFPATDAITAGTEHPNAAYQADVEAIGDALLTAGPVVVIGGATVHLTPVLWHGTDGPPTVISSYEAKALWATQKRRGDYGKGNLVPPF